MDCAKTKSSLAKITVSVPKPFLERFDEAVDGYFMSRSEAVRRGMKIVVEEIESLENRPLLKHEEQNGGSIPGGVQE